MIPTLCHIYAYTVARTWAGLGLWMLSRHNLITDGTTTLAVTPGCLSLRAVCITAMAGTLCALLLCRWWLSLLGFVLGFLMSWLRVFVLVALRLSHPPIFEALHGRCGFVSVACSLSLLFFVVFKSQQRISL